MPVSGDADAAAEWSTIAVVFTDGATSPGSHDRIEAIDDVGISDAGTLVDVGDVGHLHRGVFLVRRLDGRRRGARRSTVTCGMVSTSWRRKSICEPCIRPAIMMVKPTPMATPDMPTSVCRTRVVTWVQAMLEERLVAILLRRAVLAGRCAARR